MGVKSPVYYDNSRLKGSLQDEDCQRLDYILRAFKDNQPIEGLENVIFDLSPEQVEAYIEAGETLLEEQDRPLGTLRSYQTVGAAFMYYAKSCILGDSVGLGKTVQIAALSRLMKMDQDKKPNVLFLSEVKPSYALRKEMIKFTGEYYHHSLGTSSALMDFVDFHGSDYPNLVVPHSAILNAWFQRWLLSGTRKLGRFPYDILVIDESSILGNSSTETYKAAREIFAGAPRMVMMNATPFEANLDTFYHQLNLLDPELLPLKTHFDQKFKIFNNSGFYRKPTGRYQKTDEFRDMVSFRYLPRSRKSLGATFEDCSAEIVTCALSPEQRELLKFTSIHKMVYDAPWVLDPSLPRTCGKIDTLVDLVASLDSDGVEQVLVYVYYKEAQTAVVEALAELGCAAEILNGDTTPKESERLIREFSSGELPILVTNVQKSMNFGNVDHCIFYSYNPNPSKMVQIEGRTTRDFNIKGKHVYLLLTEGKETKTFNTVVADRAVASQAFAGSDYSMILSLLNPGGDAKTGRTANEQLTLSDFDF